MRKLFFFMAAAALLFATPAKAERVNCRDFAQAAADEWADGQIVPTNQVEMPAENELIVISAGKKYLMPRPVLGGGKVISTGVGAIAREYRVVYREELDRCRSAKNITIKVGE